MRIVTRRRHSASVFASKVLPRAGQLEASQWHRFAYDWCGRLAAGGGAAAEHVPPFAPRRSHALETIRENCGSPGSAALLVTHAEILFNLESTVLGGEEDDDDDLDPEYTCISCLQRTAGPGWDLKFSADSEHIDEVPEGARGCPETYGFPPDMRPWPSGSGPRGAPVLCTSA